MTIDYEAKMNRIEYENNRLREKINRLLKEQAQLIIDQIDKELGNEKGYSSCRILFSDLILVYCHTSKEERKVMDFVHDNFNYHYSGRATESEIYFSRNDYLD